MLTSRAVATAEFHTVARADEIPPGTIRTVHVGDEAVAVANVGGELYAVQNACIHLQGPLGEGWLEEGKLTCPWHGWQYDVRTGQNVFDRAIRLRTYEVRVENGEIQVAL